MRVCACARVRVCARGRLCVCVLREYVSKYVFTLSYYNTDLHLKLVVYKI